MNKKVNIDGKVYNYIEFFSYNKMQFLKLEDDNKNIYYYKIDSLEEEVSGEFINDELLIKELNTYKNKRIKGTSKKEKKAKETTRKIELEPRNKKENETIENYFKYLDKFYNS